MGVVPDQLFSVGVMAVQDIIVGVLGLIGVITFIWAIVTDQVDGGPDDWIN